MKTLFISLAAAVTLLGMSACTSDEENGMMTVNNSVAEAVQNNISSRTRSAGMMKCAPVEEPQVNTISYKWEDPVSVQETFPEFETPEGYYDNFLFVSNGEPFNLVMLYSNGGYRHKMGIYWYDQSGECHEKQIWNEYEESSKNWYNANGQKTDKISRLTDNAGAYTIQLPKGTKFGFYCHSFKNIDTEVTEGVRLVPPAGPIVACPYKFYTEAEKNWNYHLINPLKCQAMCTSINEWTIIGFEDISLTYPSCDKDFNDCVFAINPCQHIDGEPETEKVEGSVETNLSVADKDSYDQVKLSIHVRANTDVSVTLPIIDEVLADDFNIVAKHDIEASYSEPIKIAGYTVELVYSITEKGYLKIETKGITQEILDYCNNTYADGLTFECNLAYGKFALEGTPTISFTNEPYYYVTSCVNNSTEAKDYEIAWQGDLIYTNPLFGPEDGLNYTHRFYSTYKLEELQACGWLK